MTLIQLHILKRSWKLQITSQLLFGLKGFVSVFNVKYFMNAFLWCWWEEGWEKVGWGVIKISGNARSVLTYSLFHNSLTCTRAQQNGRELWNSINQSKNISEQIKIFAKIRISTKTRGGVKIYLYRKLHFLKLV